MASKTAAKTPSSRRVMIEIVESMIMAGNLFGAIFQSVVEDLLCAYQPVHVGLPVSSRKCSRSKTQQVKNHHLRSGLRGADCSRTLARWQTP